MKVMRLDPAYSWWFLHRDIKDDFGREMFYFDMALWDAEYASH